MPRKHDVMPSASFGASPGAMSADREALAGRIRRDAKRICTVTNTLACDVEVAE